MFRCPTCITVLTDPSDRRCQICRQRIRRRGPRVLGEEHRIGARLLPIDRALNERLHRVPFGSSRPRHMPHGDPWAGRFRAERPAPSPAPEVVAPEATPDPPAASLDRGIADPTDAAPPAYETRPAETLPVWETAPVAPGPLDPDVQALVDDLYRKARIEIAGSAPSDETPAPAPATPAVRRRGWVAAALTERKLEGGTGPFAVADG